MSWKSRKIVCKEDLKTLSQDFNVINSIEIRCKPQNNSLLPHSTGHLLYSATLNSIQKQNPELSEKLH
ncbi:MAG: hypothetical protein ABEJ83_00620, partial [Candidatus Nanohaloarchaea archaeon]